MVKKKKEISKKKVISKEQLLMVQGLLSLRNNVIKEFRMIERTLAGILDEPEEGDDYYGLVSDAMFEDYGAMQLIKNLGIKVSKK